MKFDMGKILYTSPHTVYNTRLKCIADEELSMNDRENNVSITLGSWSCLNDKQIIEIIESENTLVTYHPTGFRFVTVGKA